MDTHSALSLTMHRSLCERSLKTSWLHMASSTQNFPLLWPQANDEIEQQNRTLLKSLKVAEVEGKKWKDELDEFLLAYRTTPHSSTGTTPAFLMFWRELKTKLPELRPNKSLLDESTRDRDWNQKLAGKRYGDKQRQAVDNQMTHGDKILLKNTKQSGKLAANFEPNPYTVQTKAGQELTLKLTDGTVQPRNCSYTTPEEPDNCTGAETLEGRVVPPLVADTATTTEPKSRPSRTVRMPAKFKDFALNRWTILKDSALLRLFMFWISEQFLRDNTPFRLFIELNRQILSKVFTFR